MEGPFIRRLYYSSREINELTKISAQELRAWELRFPNLHPSRSKTGRRLYRITDLELIQTIQKQLKEGYSDDAINEYLRNPDQPLTRLESIPENARTVLQFIQEELNEILYLLN